MEKISTAWAIFQGLLLEAVPFLLIGGTIAGITRWLMPNAKWLKKLPDNPLLATIIGALMGFALPACECGNVPVARRLIASGAPMGTAFGFLFAAPVLNPIVLISTWAAFPEQPWLLIARPLGAFIISLLLSLMLMIKSEEQLLEFKLLNERLLTKPLEELSLLERSNGLIGNYKPLVDTKIKVNSVHGYRLLNESCSEFLDLLFLLIIGCIIASLVQTWLPQGWLLAIGGAPTASILALMMLAIVVSVCSSVDAFLAIGFASQVTPGALLAFLLLGPVVDLKLVGLFTVLLQPRAILITIMAACFGVLLIGQWVNLCLL